MSGLSVFFRRYFPSSIDPPTAATTTNVSSDPLSTQPVHAPRMDDSPRSDAPSTTIVDNAVQDLSIMVNVPEEESVAVMTAAGGETFGGGGEYDQSVFDDQRISARRHTKDPGATMPSPYLRWRDEQCTALQEYIVQRLFVPAASTDAEPSDDRTAHPEEEEEEEEEAETSRMLETQVEDVHPLGSSPTVVPTPPRASSHNHIPNVAETYYVASHVSELDLYVQQVSIPILKVTKVWNLRRTLERRRHHPTSRPFQHYQYDGPLATIYASVVSMDVYQSSKEDLEELHRYTEQIVTVSRLLEEADASPTAMLPQQHCKVFWYGCYAQAMNTILSDINNKCCTPSSRNATPPEVELYLSLENIPAKCIFPYHTSSSSYSDDASLWMRQPDWYDIAHMNPYCLCIGGKSNVKCESSASGDRISIQFDTNVENKKSPSPLQIRAWVVVFPLVPSTLSSSTHGMVESTNNNTASNEMTMIPSMILEYRVGEGQPLQKLVLECNRENDDAIQTEMQEIWAYIQQHHPRKEKVQSVSLVQGSENVAAAAAASDELMPDREGATNPCRSWTTPPRDTAANARNQATSTSVANLSPTNDVVPPMITSPGGSPLLLSPGERLKRRRMAVHEDFQYQKLSDLSTLLPNTEYSFYAAVLSYSQPYRTKRGDWIMSIALIDDSLQLCENGLSDSAFVHSVTINIFVKPTERDRLPMVRYAGDIIRLSDVKVQQWKEEYQLVSTRASSFVVLRGNGPSSDATTPEMYPGQDENVLMSDTEWEHMLDMWHWAQRRFLLHATMKIVHRFRLSDMRMPESTQVELYGDENTRGDLTVMVAAILPIPTEQLSGVTPRGFLRVWDGTGVPKSDILPIDTEQAREAVRNGDPPTVALIKISGIVLKLQELRQNPDLQPPEALSGRVANVAIWEKQHWDLISEGIVTVGSFIRLRNVQDSLFKDKMFRCLHVYEKSSFTPLPNLTYEVVHLLEEHNNRSLRKEPINPDSGILPLFVGNRDQNLYRTNNQASQAEDTVSKQGPSASTNDLPILHGTISPVADAATPFLPTTYQTLRDFRVAPVPSVFVGKVCITALHPAPSILSNHGIESICPQQTNDTGRFYRFGMELQQLDDSLAVIVSDDRRIASTSIGEVLFGLSANAAVANSTLATSNFQNHVQEKRLWKVQISSIVYNGSKYFLLDSLEST